MNVTPEHNRDELIIAYEDYIKLLGEELSDLSIFARIHGWRSSRVEAGKAGRKRIEKAKNP